MATVILTAGDNTATITSATVATNTVSEESTRTFITFDASAATFEPESITLKQGGATYTLARISSDVAQAKYSARASASIRVDARFMRDPTHNTHILTIMLTQLKN